MFVKLYVFKRICKCKYFVIVYLYFLIHKSII